MGKIMHSQEWTTLGRLDMCSYLFSRWLPPDFELNVLTFDFRLSYRGD